MSSPLTSQEGGGKSNRKPCQGRERELTLAQLLMLCKPLSFTGWQANKQREQIKGADFTYSTVLVPPDSSSDYGCDWWSNVAGSQVHSVPGQPCGNITEYYQNKTRQLKFLKSQSVIRNSGIFWTEHGWPPAPSLNAELYQPFISAKFALINAELLRHLIV